MDKLSIPDSMLSKMNPKDRAKLGLQTTEEAQEAFIIRSEKDLQRVIGDYLRMKGVWFYCARMDVRTSTKKGVPDFLFSWAYNPVAVEVKFAKGRLSPEQELTHAQMLRNGWRVYVIRSLPELKEIMDALQKEYEDTIRF